MGSSSYILSGITMLSQLISLGDCSSKHFLPLEMWLEIENLKINGPSQSQSQSNNGWEFERGMYYIQVIIQN